MSNYESTIKLITSILNLLISIITLKTKEKDKSSSKNELSQEENHLAL